MGGTWVADLKSANGKVHGKVHVEAEEHSGLKGNIHMQCRGTGLDKKDFWGKSDPYFELQLEHASGNGSFSTVYRSQAGDKTNADHATPHHTPRPTRMQRARARACVWSRERARARERDTIALCLSPVPVLVLC